MLRQISPDVENQAPPGVSTPAPSTKTPALRQRPKNATAHKSTKTKTPANPKQSAAPKRRALGDITNKRPSATQPKKTPSTKSASRQDKLRLHASTSQHPVPRDAFGAVEPPEIFPSPLPAVPYESGLIQFSKEEIAKLDVDDDSCDMYGRPFVQREWGFDAGEFDTPLKVFEDEPFEGRLEDFASVRIGEERFTESEIIREDEFTRLELA